MVYLLTAAVVLLAVLVLLNMSVTAAMVRRLRHVEEGRQRPPDLGGLAVGAEVPAFEATAVDGHPLTAEALSDRRTVVAFYSTSCEGCRVQAPGFAAEAKRLAAEGTQVVSVLMLMGGARDGDGPDGLRDLLASAGHLVVEDGVGALATSFEARATPSYFAVGPDRRITGKGLTLTDCLAGSQS